MLESGLVIDLVGEGRTDHGRGGDQPEIPSSGVLPILVFRLCDRPHSMRIRRQRLPQLQGKSLWQKVWFMKRQAFYSGSAGLVFVLDTEGNHPGQLEQLRRGRDFAFPDFPAAIGVAHPCIEAWLLADAPAIARALGLVQQPEAPEDPESLPAPCKDRRQNPKVRLGSCAGLGRTLSSSETTRIVLEIRDIETIRSRCPISFAPFADEIVSIIRPIFWPDGGGQSSS